MRNLRSKQRLLYEARPHHAISHVSPKIKSTIIFIHLKTKSVYTILKANLVFTADSPTTRIHDVLWPLNDFGGADETDAILPFCTNGFTNTPNKQPLCKYTPPGNASQEHHNPSWLHRTVAQVQNQQGPRRAPGLKMLGFKNSLSMDMV